MSFNTPILFIIFNRPDLERQVLERIREVKHRQLFVVADGPRADRPDDSEKVNQARAIIDELVDWDCELHKNYSETNMGCRDRVSSGITWFFEHVEEGIILEDDCLPTKSFFEYTKYWLSNMPEDVYIISGTNLIPNEEGYSYTSKYPWIWGWATTKEKWSIFKNELVFDFSLRFLLKKISESKYEYHYWLDKFKRVSERKLSSWYFIYLHKIWKLNGMGLFPPVNLVSNIGFRPDSTHTNNFIDELSLLSATEQNLPKNSFYIVPREEFNIDAALFEKAYKGRGFREISKLERLLYYVV